MKVRAAGIDLGKRRVGLAVADDLGLMAHPRPHIEGSDVGHLVERLIGWAEGEGIEIFVIGLPRTLDGREGPPARRARSLAAELRARTGRRVILLDERLTSKEAHERLASQGLDAKMRRDRVDSAAAALLLQAYLDHQAGEPR